MATPVPTFSDVQAAAERVRPFVHRTPVLTCSALDAMAGARLFFKCENLQKVGAFKYRGATNAVRSLNDAEAARGVATHSSGNHAAALALAAKVRGVPAYVVMPKNAPSVKRVAVAGYGAKIIECEPTLEARESTLRKVVEETGARFVHPYNDAQVIAGQGTAALELLDEVTDLDVVLVPVGGGGLASGTCLAAHGARPSIRVIAGEPAGADDAYRSLQAGSVQPLGTPRTVADGLRTSLSERTFGILRQHLDCIVRVEDEATVRAMRHVWERMKIVIEPSSAVPVAVALEKLPDLAGKRVGVVLSGGNVDLDALPWRAA